MSFDNRGHEGAQGRALPYTILVAFVCGVLQQVVTAEMLAEAPPLAVAGQADKYLLAVNRLERLVNRPRALPCRHRRQWPSGRHLASHMLRHEKGGGFEQCGLYQLAAPGALAFAQRRLNGNHRE